MINFYKLPFWNTHLSTTFMVGFPKIIKKILNRQEKKQIFIQKETKTCHNKTKNLAYTCIHVCEIPGRYDSQN